MRSIKNSEFYDKIVSYDEILSLISSAQDGDIIAKNKLLKLNAGLIRKIIAKYSYSKIDKNDLFQLGAIGLMKAIDRFDPSLGNMFSSYAVPLIDGEIKRFLRDDGIIKISRELKSINWKVMKYKNRHFKKTGFDASLQEMSDELNIPIDKIKSAMIAMTPVEYFSSYDSDNEGFQHDLSNNVVKQDEVPYTDMIELNEIIDNLPDLEKRVMRLRYYYDFTQAKTGLILGISQVQVSRIEKKALARLKKEFSD